MVNFEGVSNSYDLFGTNGTSPEIQVKADLTLKDASGGTVLHAAALMGLLDLLQGKKGNMLKWSLNLERCFGSGTWWIWRCFEITCFIWGVYVLFSYDVRWWCFLRVSHRYLVLNLRYMVHVVLSDSGKLVSAWVGQHDEVTTSHFFRLALAGPSIWNSSWLIIDQFFSFTWSYNSSESSICL